MRKTLTDEEAKTCRCCKVSKGELKHSKMLATREDGQTHYLWCRTCTRRRQREKYKRDPEMIKKIIMRSEKRVGLFKRNCRARSHYAIRKGIITKLDYCQKCEVTDVRIEMHHHDYTKHLDVTFLCTSCHSKADKKQKQY